MNSGLSNISTSQVPRLHPSAVAVRQCHLEKLGISQAIPHDVYLTRTVIKCGSSPKRVCGSTVNVNGIHGLGVHEPFMHEFFHLGFFPSTKHQNLS